MSLSNVPAGLELYLLSEIAALFPDKNVLYIFNDDKSLDKYKDTISKIILNKKIFAHPAWDCLPYDKISPSQGILNDRFSFYRNIEA